jgi:hypothetical protein
MIFTAQGCAQATPQSKNVLTDQKKKSAKSEISNWQEIKWERWELKFLIPPDFMETTEMPEEQTVPEDGIFNESKTFKRSIQEKSNVSPLELEIEVSNQKGEKFKTEFESGKTELSQEDLLKFDFIVNTEDVKNADTPTLETKYLEIDGQNGLLVTMNASFDAGKTVKPENEIVLVWLTYRVFKGNIQRITMTVQGKRKELDVMKKIINTVKFH